MTFLPLHSVPTSPRTGDCDQVPGPDERRVRGPSRVAVAELELDMARRSPRPSTATIGRRPSQSLWPFPSTGVRRGRARSPGKA